MERIRRVEPLDFDSWLVSDPVRDADIRRAYCGHVISVQVARPAEDAAGNPVWICPDCESAKYTAAEMYALDQKRLGQADKPA